MPALRVPLHPYRERLQRDGLPADSTWTLEKLFARSCPVRRLPFFKGTPEIEIMARYVGYPQARDVTFLSRGASFKVERRTKFSPRAAFEIQASGDRILHDSFWLEAALERGPWLLERATSGLFSLKDVKREHVPHSDASWVEERILTFDLEAKTLRDDYICYSY